MIRLCTLGLMALALAACAPQNNRAHVHVNSHTGQLSPSVGTSLGPISLAAGRNGGAIGTRFGALGLSAGF